MRCGILVRSRLVSALSVSALVAAGCAAKSSPAPAGPRADVTQQRVAPHVSAAPQSPATKPAAVVATTRPTTAPVASYGVKTFDVHHALTVKDIPAGAKKVRVWFWLPDDDDCQKLLDLVVADAPAGYKLTRDAANGHRYLYAEVDEPKGAVSLATDFIIRRHGVSIPLDPAKVGPLTEVHRNLFAEYLRLDTPHMEVDEPIRKLASEICGDDTNVVTQARKLGEWVVDHSDHYSIAGAPKSSGAGDAKYCLANKGGGCTDQHALFICLARARGIPTRLHFGSMLRGKNEGKEHDPGYRCWVQFFAPNYGWVPMDLSEADVNKGARQLYLSGLDDHRVRFAEGRDLELNPRQEGPRLNVMIIAHVEVDGKPHKAFDRVLRFDEVRDGAVEHAASGTVGVGPAAKL